MKKSVMLMAGILTVALAGSAQAATMFAVQNAAAVDQATISDAGDINTSGKIGIGLAQVPVAPGFPAMAALPGVFHAATAGASAASASFLAQQVSTPGVNGLIAPSAAPNFSFFRVNRSNAGVYSLPAANDWLGYLNFGTIDTTVDPTASRKFLAAFSAKAEGATATNLTPWNSITNTPTYFNWTTMDAPNGVNSAFTGERMRLTSGGTLAIGTTTVDTKTKLQVVGLPIFADNTAATTGGGLLAPGAFYRTPTGVLMVAF